MNQCCNTCAFYQWYFDLCEKFKVKVDGREVHDCWAERKEK